MSLRSSALDDKSKLQTGRAERIRGGCIPCPVRYPFSVLILAFIFTCLLPQDGSICYIIPIPCCC